MLSVGRRPRRVETGRRCLALFRQVRALGRPRIVAMSAIISARECRPLRRGRPTVRAQCANGQIDRTDAPKIATKFPKNAGAEDAGGVLCVNSGGIIWRAPGLDHTSAEGPADLQSAALTTELCTQLGGMLDFVASRQIMRFARAEARSNCEVPKTHFCYKTPAGAKKATRSWGTPYELDQFIRKLQSRVGTYGQNF